ncbi:Ubiquinone biosynthesis protein [Coemansia sp. RSA 989]|nr:ubiquinone biosynthesis protein COQ4 mitochondrial [Coemansia mojavensis]KAJ1742636.1 Ubiquinone biosynthesis protein [Coemansia sp. RSA 1086]KAJ1865973.1 Ubiquinone biosynthesis protein [Coemansia sp. RSA 989]KAJ1873145.1 Ubiquinone biosynthesis protein [Coemansia sp. RSA 990]KAJ2651831.1 Ubiquinone biosynthesis protein [Coemansia sp. RSA 1250]KAJ2674859.1 Ubiquinone biosynthesis protein [Coemansia sp. RSA 1085]
MLRLITSAVSRAAPLTVVGASYMAVKSLAAFTSPDAPQESSRSMKPLYQSHRPTTPLQKAFIAAGSALMGFGDPTDGSHIAALGDATANGHMDHLRNQMLKDPVGRRILRERPQISFTHEEWEKLKTLPAGSFGRTYYEQMARNNISWTTRPPVRFVDNEEDAYLLLRYRQCHDFYHVILDLDISVVEELAIKVFEWQQTKLPVALVAGAFGPLRLPPKERSRFFDFYLPWALQCGSSSKPIISVYWEEMWHRPIDDIRKEMGVWLLPQRNKH